MKKKWDGLYICGHAPQQIVWQNEEPIAPKNVPVPTRHKWSKFAELDLRSCKYAGYENDEYGEDFPDGLLYLRYSLRNGEVTGAKYSHDDISTVSRHWNDYDTPSRAVCGPRYVAYLSPLHVEVES